MREPAPARAAWLGYGLGLAVFLLGIERAASAYPDSFDWTRTVVSALASQKHNPDGSAWFAGGLALAVALLWPATNRLRPPAGRWDGWARVSIVTLRAGLVFGMLVGVERLLIHHLSDLVRKGHEAIALLAFLGLYLGVFGLYVHRARQKTACVWAVLPVLVPLVAIGLSQLALYLDQRDLGWVDRDWREEGAPVWLSFAFWQWLAVAVLWGGIGHLLVTRRAVECPETAAGTPRSTSPTADVG